MLNKRILIAAGTARGSRSGENQHERERQECVTIDRPAPIDPPRGAATHRAGEPQDSGSTTGATLADSLGGFLHFGNLPRSPGGPRVDPCAYTDAVRGD